jgi:hypothetical protein
MLFLAFGSHRRPSQDQEAALHSGKLGTSLNGMLRTTHNTSVPIITYVHFTCKEWPLQQGFSNVEDLTVLQWRPSAMTPPLGPGKPGECSETYPNTTYGTMLLAVDHPTLAMAVFAEK